MSAESIAWRIHIRGLVQGVGFRPFVYHVAQALGVRGWVRNDADGVWIHAEARAAVLQDFVVRLRAEAPPAADIRMIDAAPADFTHAQEFRIIASVAAAAPTAEIAADLAICADCLRELFTPGDARCGYAYINCTHCGPRYSIIRRLPYDRAHTTMAEWPLCPACRAQYEDPRERRFHAQPVACPACGPDYTLGILGAVGSSAVGVGATSASAAPFTAIANGADAIAQTAARLRAGQIIGIKGIGGYHVACDARNTVAIAALRARKFRKEKPFALLVGSLAQAHELVMLDPAAEALLTSVARPIVLAPVRGAPPIAMPTATSSVTDIAGDANCAAAANSPYSIDLAGIAPGRSELGVMLPYTPLHHLLIAAGVPLPLVLTSANRSDQPIAYEDDDARRRLAGICDALLIGQRGIARRVDDSVVTTRRGRPFMIRRARGYAPRPVAQIPSEQPILAVGGDLKNALALVVHGTAYVSQHLGDLDDDATRRSFRETITDLLAMYAVSSDELIIAHDAHPQYAATRCAQELPCARRVAVQHHAAHIAATLAEAGQFERRVVGLALDGTGYGDDGAIWGGEVLIGSMATGFERRAHLPYVALPGGDAAARWPVQAAAAYLAEDAERLRLAAPLFAFPARFEQAVALVRSGVRCHPSSSAGRLFDAAAAVLGFTREITYEGQAAIWLEQLAQAASAAPPYASAFVIPENEHLPLSPRELLLQMISERRAGRPAEEIARRFHATLAEGFARAAREVLAREALDAVVLSGGVCQNRLLLDAVADALEPHAEVLISQAVPVNDGGICLGQAAIAARCAAT